MNIETIAEHDTGRVRRIQGTDWPIIHQLQRIKFPYMSRPEWVVVEDLCNGVPFQRRVYQTRSEAMTHFADLDPDEA